MGSVYQGVSGGAVQVNRGHAEVINHAGISTDSRNVANRKALQMPAGQSYGITFWLNYNAHTLAGGIKFFLGKATLAPPQRVEYAVTWNAVTERLEFWHGSGGVDYDFVSADMFGALPTKEWVFVVARRDAAQGTISISVNDKKDTAEALELGGIGSPSPEFRIGLSADGGGDGVFRLDEIGIWKTASVIGRYDSLTEHIQELTVQSPERCGCPA